MKKGQYIGAILRAEKTVFSIKDIALLWGEVGANATRVRISQYVKKGELHHIRYGFYAKDKNYNKQELASRIFTPSYVSFETVLGIAGITFQYYSQIFAATYLTREIDCDHQLYVFRKIKKLVLTNAVGIENKEGSSIATKERAFLDTIYLNKDYHFDNLDPLDWDRVFEILPIYGNRRMEKRVKEFYEIFKSNQ